MAEEIIWRKSSRCGSSACVEIGRREGMVLVRDSSDPRGLELAFSRAAWTVFRTALSDGAFRGSGPA